MSMWSMYRKTVLLTLVVVILLATPACRSRRNVTPPAAAPAAETVTPATPVATPERDFVAPAAEERDVLSEDMAEANRQARARGWIQDAFFQFDASTLDADAQQALRASAGWLREHPEFRLRIEGHCDERGTEQYNLALGDRRAETAVAYLVTLGVDRTRIETVSLGEERPFETGSDEQSWAQNRRAHLVLAGRR